MNLKSLFKKYIVPHEINFVSMLQDQAIAIDHMIEDLSKCFMEKDQHSCDAIMKDVHNTKNIKENNMNQLLNAFITPIDRESIYRTITGLDAISISVKHFVLETKAYKIHELSQYKKLFRFIKKGSKKLKLGFEILGENNHLEIAKLADEIRKITDKISQEYIKEMVKLSNGDDIGDMFRHREILFQLKQIGHHLHNVANTLEDIVIKMD